MLHSVSSSFPAVYAAEFFGAEAANDCTPSAGSMPDPSADAGLVAQSSASGGGCIPFAGDFIPTRVCSILDLRDGYRADSFGLFGDWGCSHMDAPYFLPSGSHAAFSSTGAVVIADGFSELARGM